MISSITYQNYDDNAAYAMIVVGALTFYLCKFCWLGVIQAVIIAVGTNRW